MTRTISDSAKKIRSAACRETDIAALRAIAQAAVDVELFTIPLYMGALYSIVGMHQITGDKENFYQNRWWPGPAASAKPDENPPKHPFNTPGNAYAFNTVFSVFIEEMLHLQMAANVASAIGVTPSFTSSKLQNEKHGWTCYGPEKTEIPYIVDLNDVDLEGLKDDNSGALGRAAPDKVRVNIAELNAHQILLFMAIEQPEEEAKARIKAPANYFPSAPFADWKSGRNLPLFGTIGCMYQCYYDYMNLRYEDDKEKRLWNYVFQPCSRQNDLFNTCTKGHPEREFCHFETIVTETDPDKAFTQAVTMMDAITDQGEGSELNKEQRAALLAVKPIYQASYEALKVDYPRYTDTGCPADSASAEARHRNGAFDHYERFTCLGRAVAEGEVTTWGNWSPGTKEPWEASSLQPKAGGGNPTLPPSGVIAAAMNRIRNEKDGKYYDKVSKGAVGSIAGITTVLNKYWDPKSEKVSFPYPSMVGSGDRMAICWALFGKAPDLSRTVELPGGQGGDAPCPVLHSCQGLDFYHSGNDCAKVDVFHSCRGSNACKAQGGCGFVQKVTGGGNCSFALVAAKSDGDKAADDGPFSAPGDNKCGGFGGCAVPISASQILPGDGTMQLFHFNNKCEPERIDGLLSFEKGEKVYDVAYRAYLKVMEHGGVKPETTLPKKPEPNDLRLVFPPST